jgi:SAM-dependent methyltransferase
MSFENENSGTREGNGLCNLDFVERYIKLLQNHLPENLSIYTPFFAGTQRLRNLAASLQRHVKGNGLSVLNVGCGPFATELFVERLQSQYIQSVDYTPEFAHFFDTLKQEGYIANTSFKQADAMKVKFPETTFDLIIIHDVFYEQALEMNSLVIHLCPYLKPGGYIYLDFVNARTEWIWRIFGKGGRFRRYDPVLVRKFLEENGFSIVEFDPVIRTGSIVLRTLHLVLWNIFRASNNYSVFAQRSDCK